MRVVAQRLYACTNIMENAGELNSSFQPEDNTRTSTNGVNIEDNYNFFTLETEKEGARDVSSYGAWSVSSQKPGHGVERLLDKNYKTYWQSDGKQPHYVDVRFSKRQALSQVGIFCDYVEDESYTPRVVYIYAGNGPHDLMRIHRYTLNQPEGWNSLLLDPSPNPQSGSLSCFHIRLEIIRNHQDGKDTRIREIRLIGPNRLKTSRLRGFHK